MSDARSRIAERLQENEFLRRRLTVTREDYREAVESLLPIALADTSGSRAAAQVLLSTYNGHNYHMDITDLCVLDLAYVEKALIVMRGRTLLSIEPHSLIENGSERFLQLEDAWPGLHNSRRYQKSE
jgi:hypothetical protein